MYPHKKVKIILKGNLADAGMDQSLNALADKVYTKARNATCTVICTPLWNIVLDKYWSVRSISSSIHRSVATCIDQHCAVVRSAVAVINQWCAKG